MKRNFSVANLAAAVLCTTPLLLTGCQAIEGLFSDSPQRTYEQSHHKGSRATSSSQSTQYTTSTSGSTSTGKRTSTTPATGTQSTNTNSIVPIEPPTVPTIAPTTGTPTTSTTPAAASGTTAPAPTGMAPPTVSQ